MIHHLTGSETGSDNVKSCEKDSVFSVTSPAAHKQKIWTVSDRKHRLLVQNHPSSAEVVSAAAPVPTLNWD